MKKKNVVVAQSGGPTPVINNSLRGIVEACRSYPDRFGTVYGGKHGIEGVLKEELLNLSEQPEEEISLLRTSPAAGSVGTCRYKLKSDQQEDFERVIDVFKAHDVGYFFYIGGNDSMDTANKIAQIAKEKGLDLVSTGVAKTIDNDVGDSEFKLIDHTPGYGSVARYWSHIVQNAEEENRGSCPADPVMVMQAMGRKIGFIPASARLADPKREMPLLIAMAESGVSLDQLTDAVNDMIRKQGRCLLVVSEGFDVGSGGELADSFGHAQYGSGDITVQQAIVSHLNRVGIPANGVARGQVMGTDQRSTAVYASTVDLDEAYNIGQNAVSIAANEGGGYMSTLLRTPGKIYHVSYDKAPLELVANSERSFPSHWIAENRLDVTDEFVEYARPLIGNDWVSVPLVDGRQRFAKLAPLYAETKLDKYIPQRYR